MAEADEAHEVVSQQDAAASAHEKRDRGQQRAADRKSYPKEAEAPPSQRSTKGGETAYSVDRLIAEAPAFLGQPTHVAAGALHEVEKPYLTIAEATKLIDAWLAREV